MNKFKEKKERKKLKIIYLDAYSYIPPKGYKIIAHNISIHGIDKFEDADLIVGHLHLRDGRIFDVWKKIENK